MIERVAMAIIYFVATIAILVFVAILVAIAFLMIPMKQALSAELYRVPSVCKPLAERYGVPETVSREQAIQLMGRLNLYSWWPGVKECRKAVKQEWKL